MDHYLRILLRLTPLHMMFPMRFFHYNHFS
jgi:hypothetical protein